MCIEQALKRPLNYNELSPEEQWSIDKNLGILDWSPSKEEIKKYQVLRKIQKKNL
jgi:hypothetical protein